MASVTLDNVRKVYAGREVIGQQKPRTCHPGACPRDPSLSRLPHCKGRAQFVSTVPADAWIPGIKPGMTTWRP
jgi:hypothetical protein